MFCGEKTFHSEKIKLKVQKCQTLTSTKTLFLAIPFFGFHTTAFSAIAVWIYTDNDEIDKIK